MAVRPRMMITREGWYYLFVILFIVGGAVLREVNLLVVLAGAMLGPMLFNWRMVYRSFRKLELRRSAPPRCEAGQALRVTIEVKNTGPGTVWMATAIDGRRKAGQRQRRLTEVWFPQIRPQETAVAAYRLVFAERGRYRLGPLRLVSRFPFGLWRCTLANNSPHRIVVWPRVGQMTPAWRDLLKGDRAGAQHSKSRRGHDGEFYALRPFAPGDSMRMIHWRSTAKMREPMVRQSERLELPELCLVIDPFLPRNPSPEEAKRLELLMRLAASAVLDICRDSGGAVTLVLMGEERQIWKSAPSQRFAEQVLDELAILKGANSAAVDEGLDAAFEAAPSTNPIVLSTRRQAEAVSEERGNLHWLSTDDAAIYFADNPAAKPYRTLMRSVQRSVAENEPPLPVSDAVENAAEEGTEEAIHANH